MLRIRLGISVQPGGSGTGGTRLPSVGKNCEFFGSFEFFQNILWRNSREFGGYFGDEKTEVSFLRELWGFLRVVFAEASFFSSKLITFLMRFKSPLAILRRGMYGGLSKVLMYSFPEYAQDSLRSGSIASKNFLDFLYLWAARSYGER
jgi:hypothetical protein